MDTRSVISSKRTKIEFCVENNKTRRIEVTIGELDDIARLTLHRKVLILYSICKARSIGKGNDRIYCPYFDKNYFILRFREDANNPIKLLTACSSCISGYDAVLNKHLLCIPKKMILLRKKFGQDIGNIIIKYGWGI